eukprot:NODE_517_length_7343_cov_0.253313.p6 type:complete len:158 gc:universal NODE_517_length_7343_cov_0.253313:6803-7276(+)
MNNAHMFEYSSTIISDDYRAFGSLNHFVHTSGSQTCSYGICNRLCSNKIRFTNLVNFGVVFELRHLSSSCCCWNLSLKLCHSCLCQGTKNITIVRCSSLKVLISRENREFPQSNLKSLRYSDCSRFHYSEAGLNKDAYICIYSLLPYDLYLPPNDNW